jgi:hypothetical protein
MLHWGGSSTNLVCSSVSVVAVVFSSLLADFPCSLPSPRSGRFPTQMVWSGRQQQLDLCDDFSQVLLLIYIHMTVLLDKTDFLSMLTLLSLPCPLLSRSSKALALQLDLRVSVQIINCSLNRDSI